MAMHALLQSPDSHLRCTHISQQSTAAKLPYRLGQFGPSRRMDPEDAALLLLGAVRRAAARLLYSLWSWLYRGPREEPV
jgi:hypothetical protein